MVELTTSGIIPSEFPELRRLAWNRNPERPVSAEEAFGLYERYWRFVDAAELTDRERDLVDALSDRFGAGFRLR